MFKKKEFNIIWAIIGFFLCLLPLIIYAIVYATQSDQMVVIRVGPVTATQLSTGGVTWSDDRHWWWNGAKWCDASVELPPGVQLSDDQGSWWDGSSWRTVPAGAVSEQPPPVRPLSQSPPADS